MKHLLYFLLIFFIITGIATTISSTVYAQVQTAVGKILVYKIKIEAPSQSYEYNFILLILQIDSNAGIVVSRFPYDSVKIEYESGTLYQTVYAATRSVKFPVFILCVPLYAPIKYLEDLPNFVGSSIALNLSGVSGIETGYDMETSGGVIYQNISSVENLVYMGFEAVKVTYTCMIDKYVAQHTVIFRTDGVLLYAFLSVPEESFSVSMSLLVEDDIGKAGKVSGAGVTTTTTVPSPSTGVSATTGVGVSPASPTTSPGTVTPSGQSTSAPLTSTSPSPAPQESSQPTSPGAEASTLVTTGGRSAWLAIGAVAVIAVVAVALILLRR